jgi:sugar lactone lactonase YvrE
MHLDFRPAADLKLQLGESPVFDERTGQLFFVDIAGRALHVLESGRSAPRSFTFESEVCSLGLAASGRLIVALRDAVILFDHTTGSRDELCRIEADRPETRLNDGKVGPDGAFWVGSMDNRSDKQPVGALYRVLPTGAVERKLQGLIVSNGLAWTADGEMMFHADSRGPWIDSWRFDRWTGAISGRRRFAEPNDIGRPDGGSCDAEGFYWSAGVSAGRLNRYAPDGGLAESFELGIPAPTMPCFGGPDFRTLFLTSLGEGKDGSEPTGGVFAAPAPVAGFAPWRFLDL